MDRVLVDVERTQIPHGRSSESGGPKVGAGPDQRHKMRYSARIADGTSVRLVVGGEMGEDARGVFSCGCVVSRSEQSNERRDSASHPKRVTITQSPPTREGLRQPREGPRRRREGPRRPREQPRRPREGVDGPPTGLDCYWVGVGGKVAQRTRGLLDSPRHLR